MKKILALVLVLVMLVGMLAGCGCQKQVEDPTEPFVPQGPTADEAMEYLRAIYKDTEEPTPTPVNYDRYGIVRIAGVPFTVVWTVDVSEDLIKIVVNEDGSVTIDVDETCEVATPYTLTATITDEYGNTASHSWDMILPAAVDMVEIVKAAYALAPGESLPYQSTLRGKIISIDTVYSPDYKNITVTIVVEGAEDMPVMCYRLKGEGCENLMVGNIITVTGTLKNYNGTIEFDAGCVLENVEQGEAIEAPTDTGEILDQAYDLANGESLPYPVTLTGKVTEIKTPYDANYGNITVEIVMEGYEKQPILCYRLKGTGASEIAIGDTITVSGIIKNYNGTIEFDSGCQLIERISGGGTAKQESFDQDQILSDAKKLSSGESLDYYANLTGKVTEIDTPYDKEYGNISVYINVGGTKMLCYRLKSGAADCSKIAVGDTVTVRGVIENYKGSLQFGSGSTLEDRISGGGVAKPESTDQAQILSDAKKLSSGESLDYYATLTGKVTEIDTPYDKEYKNISVIINVDGTTMLCYRLKSGDADCSKIAVGDTITVRGVIENYKGEIQFGAGSTLKKRVSGGGVAKPESSNASQILSDAKNLADGESLDYYATLTGKVTEIDTPYDKEYKNISVIIDVDGTTMLCYRLKSGAYDCSKIAVGDTITVRGVIENYKGEIQFGAGSTLQKRVSGGGVAKPESTNEADILADASQLASGEKLDYYATLTGTVTEIKTPYDASYGNITVYMDVNGTKIQCYRLKSGAADASKIKVTDTITVRGVIENYNGTLEFLAGCTLQKLVEGPGVTDDPVTPDGGITISFADKANRTNFTTEQQVWQENGITVTNDKASSTSDVADYANPARFYKGSALTIEYPAMTRIVFDVAFSDRVAALTDSLSGMEGIVVTVDDLLVTVDLYEATDSFVIEKLANQTRIYDITIYTGTTPPEGGDEGGDEGGNTGNDNVGTTVSALENGDQVIIYAPAYNKALSADKVTASSYYNKGVDITVTDGVVSGYGDAEIWTVIVNSDGTYSFANGGQNIGLADSYSSMNLGTTHDDWALESLGNALYNVKNTGRGNYMEWYAEKDNWSTYASSSAATDDQFQLRFYVIGKGTLSTESSGGNEGGNEGGDDNTGDEGGNEGGEPVTGLNNGDQVVIFAPAYNKALSVTKTGHYNVGVDVTVSDGTVTGYADTEIFTVIVNSDGTYSFANGGQNIGLADSYSSMNLGTTHDDWALEDLGDGLYNIKNTGRGNYMEWYSSYSNWSTYTTSSAATDDQFQLSFYVIGKGILGSDTTTGGDDNTGDDNTGDDNTGDDTTTTVTLENGDQVVIYAPAYNKALSVTKTGHYNVGVDVTVSDGTVTGYADTEIFTVIVNSDGTYSFANGGQNIGLADSYSSMNLGTTHDDWALEDLGNGLYNVKNTGRGNYMEWYNSYSNWSTYTTSSAATDDQFQLSFYVIGKGILGSDTTTGGDDNTGDDNTGDDNTGDDNTGDVTLGEGVNISFADKANRTTFTTEQQVWEQNGITVTNDKASSTSDIGDYAKPARFYKSTSLTIEYPAMGRIVFNVAYADRVAALTDSLKSMSGVTVTVDNLVVTVDLDEATDSFVIATMANQTRISDITVYPVVSSEGGDDNTGDDNTGDDNTGDDNTGDTTTTVTLENGDQVVIYAPAYNKALSVTKTGHYNVGVDVAVSDGTVTGYADTEIFTVIVNSDGTYSFANGGQNIGLADSYSSMNLGTTHDDWALEDLGNGLYNVKNTGRGNYMEWYNSYSNWSTYTTSSAATDDQFQLSLYVIDKGILGTEVPSDHEHSYEAVVTAPTCTATGYTTYTCECGDSYTADETAVVAHKDENLDVVCDFDGCTQKIAPAADSTLSLFTANSLGMALSTSNKYYVEGVVSEVTDAKNGVFLISDGTGATFLIRLPVDADGTTHANWTCKVVLGDTVRVYGKVSKFVSSTTTPCMQGGVLTVLAHTHVYNDATCTKPATCICGYENGDPLGHKDESGDGKCDACGVSMTEKSVNMTINTLEGDANSGTLDGTTRTWESTKFTVVVDKGTSASIDTAARDHMRLRTNNTVTFSSNDGTQITRLAVTSTSSSYASKLVDAFNAVAGATAVAEDNVVIVTFSAPVETVTIKLTAASRFNAVTFYYE